MRERDEARAILASATANMSTANVTIAAPPSQPLAVAPGLPQQISDSVPVPVGDLLNADVIAAINDKCKVNIK